MSGPEHYAEAERLAELAHSPTGAALLADGIDIAALAQVHATLALAAATVASRFTFIPGEPTREEHVADNAWPEATR